MSLNNNLESQIDTDGLDLNINYDHIDLRRMLRDNDLALECQERHPRP